MARKTTPVDVTNSDASIAAAKTRKPRTPSQFTLEKRVMLKVINSVAKIGDVPETQDIEVWMPCPGAFPSRAKAAKAIADDGKYRFVLEMGTVTAAKETVEKIVLK